MLCVTCHVVLIFFFFNDTATTEIYTLSLHDALPILIGENFGPDERYDWLTLRGFNPVEYVDGLQAPIGSVSDRKSTRLNSSHSQISYAAFCLKKKKRTYTQSANVMQYHSVT